MGYYLVGMEYEQNGRKMVDSFVGVFTCTQTMYPQTRMEAMSCRIDNGMSIRAPEEKILALVKNPGVRVDISPAWEQQGMRMLEQRYANQNAQMQQMFQRDLQSSIDLHNTLMNNQQRQFDAGQRNAQRQGQARDNAAQGTANSMADVNDFSNPVTGEAYSLSSQYKHTYQNSDGTVLQTNAAYAPGPATVWRELQPR